MHRILPIVGDVGLGILVAVVVSQKYGVTDPYLIGWGILWAFLPDIDALPELLKRGEVAAHREHVQDHREKLHMPMFWLIPLWFMSVSFGVAWEIAFWAILMHFLHDSVFTGWGVPWFAPFARFRIKFFTAYDNSFSLKAEDLIRIWWRHELPTAITQYGDRNWVWNTYGELTPVLVIEYLIFAYSPFVLLWHLSA